MLPGASAVGRAATIHAVGVRIVPAPKSVVESREILRVLQSFGTITTYRWLKHDALSSAPNQALAIYQDEAAMKSLLHACPLTFDVDQSISIESPLGKTLHSQLEDEPEFDAGESSTMQEIPQSLANHEFDRTFSGASDSYQPHALTTTGELQRRNSPFNNRPQLFRVQADLWRGKHTDWLERHPFWGPFKLQKRGVIPQDLGKRVPLPGLTDINVKDKAEIPIRILLRRADELEDKASLQELMRELRSRDSQNPSESFT